jgi:hypothetical protein
MFLIPFSLLWCFMIFNFEYRAMTANNVQVFTVIWGIPFIVIGIHMVVGRFFVDIYQRSQTYYGVTDRRVLILSGIFAREVKTISLHNLNETSLTERADGSGDIAFGSLGQMSMAWRGSGWPGMERKMVPMFEAVDNVRQVYDLIQQAQRDK